ncbi:MAG: PorV/PorQ family protein [Ignavibacteriales bacterium]|nr:MAG: PorV/PorQ family protein [Ignavibacteriales bacterium]
MFYNFTKILKISLLSLLLVVEVFAGGGKRNGTAGAQELLIPIGARGLALNGAYIAGLEGIESIYYNPAGVGFSKNSTEAMFSHMNYIADIGFSFAAVTSNFEGFGTLGFSVRTLEFGDIPVTTEENPYGTGATFSPTFVTLGITYANALTDRIRVGLNVNLVTEKIMRTSATGVSFDVGVQYNGIAEVDGLKLGIVLKNFGPQMKFSGPDLIRTANDQYSLRGEQFYVIDAATFELPSQLELGLAYERRFEQDYKIILASSFQNNNFSNDEYKLAGEFAFQDMVFLRGGYSYAPEAETDQETIFGPTFGAGFNVNAGIDVTVDYAYRWARYFDANHMFAIKLGF